jgi:hypothetical protein
MSASEMHSGDALIGHLERHLGQIQEGWSKDATGEQLPFQVVRFDDTPVVGASSFSTLGLSRTTLHGPGQRSFHQELMFASYKRYETWNIPALLQQLGSQALSRGSAYLRGECIGPRGRLFPASVLEAVYFALPVYWPDSLAVHRPAAAPPIQLTWVVPLFASEARYIVQHGWAKFEEVLRAHDPDLLDLERPPFSVGS